MFSEDFEMSDIRPGCSSELDTDDRLVLHQHDHLQSSGSVATVNVTECANVHVGTSVVSITQNVENIEVTKGKILGLELMSSQNGKRLRCNIAVCMCWTLVAASVLVFSVLYLTLPAKLPKRLILDIQEPWYVNRDNWYANDERNATLLKLPVAKVLIGNSGSSRHFCEQLDDCILVVLDIQTDHQSVRRWSDIAPNFLVGGNGLVFEGRGANFKGAMAGEYNSISIGVMFLGNYEGNQTCNEQFDNVNVLLKELVRKRVLTEDYELFGQCQLVGDVVTPGPHVMDNMDRFPHWNPVNKSTCVR